jgi:hypothetical protein
VNLLITQSKHKREHISSGSEDYDQHNEDFESYV